MHKQIADRVQSIHVTYANHDIYDIYFNMAQVAIDACNARVPERSRIHMLPDD